MSNQIPKFGQQLASSLSAVAESMRTCAQLADAFAKIVADLQYLPEEATLPKGKGKRKTAFFQEDGETPKKRKRITKPKDPNAPKKPASAYLVFQNEVRHELKNQNPNLTNSEILSLISDQWKKMSDEQKQTYFRIVEKAKVQYSKAKKDYETNLAESQATEAAAAEAETPQKEAAMPRGPKLPTATATVPGASRRTTSPKAARPLKFKANEVSPSSVSSEEEEEEEEESPIAGRRQREADSSEDESDESEPSPKKRRTGSVQPKLLKKSSKV